MKIFTSGHYTEQKINFVDDNNVFVGYDSSQLCCEDHRWFISDRVHREPQPEEPQPEELPGWFFDTSYFESIDDMDGEDENMVVFRITNGVEEKFLHLYNCHNGYYSHGFEMKNGEAVIRNGNL